MTTNQKIEVVFVGDTKGLEKALDEVNKYSSNTAKELQEVERLLKFNPGNTELLAQKIELLGNQVVTTKEKLEQLKDVQKQVKQVFESGDMGEEQYRAFQRELIETESQLEQLQNKLDTSKTNWQQFSSRTIAAGEGIKKTGSQMTTLVTGPLVQGAKNLIGLAQASGEAANEILNLSETTGLSSDSIQEWRYVATDAGVGTDVMTNAVESLITKMPQLGLEGDKATEQLEKLGISYSDLQTLSPEEQINTLMKSMSEMDDVTERNALAAELFGGAWKDIAPILDMGADEMDALRQEAHDTNNVIGNESLNGANDFRTELDKLMLTLQNTAIQIGADLAPMLRDTLGPLIQEVIVPALESFADKVKTLIEWFADLSPGMQDTILIVIGLVAALGPILMVVGTIIPLIGSLMPVLSALGAAFSLLISPVGLVVAAIVALIAIVVLLWENWEEVSAWLLEIWENLKNGAVAVFDWIMGFFEEWGATILIVLGGPIAWLVALIIEYWEEIKEFTITAFESILEFFIGVFDKIVGVFENALNWIDKKTGGKFQSITDTIRTYIEMAKNILITVWDFIKNTFKNAMDFVKSLVTGDFQGMKDAISNQMDNIKNTISDIWNKVMEFFKGIDLKQIGIDIIKGLISGIGSMATAVVDKAKDVVGGAINGAKKLLGIKSPSRVFMEIGEFSGEGLEKGLRGMGGRVEKAGQRLADNSIPTLQTGFDAPKTKSNGSGGAVGAVTIVIEKMMVRSDEDINKISRQLELLMRKNKIARGDV